MTLFSFDSLEDMQAFIREQGDAALAKMSEEQRGLTWGSYAMMPTQDFLVFGYVFTEQEIEIGERAAGGDESEIEYALATTRAAMERGYLFGRWYSTVEPDGELGTNHAANCWPIDSHMFNIAASLNWDGRVMVTKEEGAWLADKYIEMATATADRRSN